MVEVLPHREKMGIWGIECRIERGVNFQLLSIIGPVVLKNALQRWGCRSLVGKDIEFDAVGPQLEPLLSTGCVSRRLHCGAAWDAVPE